jgi:hypothetical protein
MKVAVCGFLGAFLLLCGVAGGQTISSHNRALAAMMASNSAAGQGHASAAGNGASAGQAHGSAAGNGTAPAGVIYLFCWGSKQAADGTTTIYVTPVVAWGPSADPSHDSADSFSRYMGNSYGGGGGTCPAGSTKAQAEEGRAAYMARWTSENSKKMGTKVVEVDWNPGASK